MTSAGHSTDNSNTPEVSSSGNMWFMVFITALVSEVPARDFAALYMRLFQSTHPSRVRHGSLPSVEKVRGFQSTHPARGATAIVIVLLTQLIISIHAPREGCDVVVIIKSGVSRHPLSPAQRSSNVTPNSSASTLAVANPIRCGSRADFGRGLSDHASHAHTRPTVLLPIARHRSCCDNPTLSRIDLKPISILLILVQESLESVTGGTVQPTARHIVVNFNPRTPRGVRPSTSRSNSMTWNFNPRTPRGVRLDCCRFGVQCWRCERCTVRTVQ